MTSDHSGFVCEVGDYAPKPDCAVCGRPYTSHNIGAIVYCPIVATYRPKPDLFADDTVEAMVQAAFATVSRNPSDHETVVAYRAAIRMALDAAPTPAEPSDLPGEPSQLAASAPKVEPAEPSEEERQAISYATRWLSYAEHFQQVATPFPKEKMRLLLAALRAPSGRVEKEVPRG